MLDITQIHPDGVYVWFIWDFVEVIYLEDISLYIDGMLDKIESELGEKSTVVATGGLSKCIIENCKHDIVYDKDLLLRGLWLIYQKHKNN